MRPTVAEIDLSALEFNVKQIQKEIGLHTQVLAIVKANAYGHDDVIISKKLEMLKIPFLGVACLEEGMKLRNQGIKSKILVLSGGQDPSGFAELHHYRLTPVFYNLEFLSSYDQFCRKKNKKGVVHLKFDTGMNRLGFTEEAANPLFSVMKKFKNITYEGMMSHFANSERLTHFNQEQIQLFRKLKEKSPISFSYYHMANSGAILNRLGMNENLVRPGLALYGAYPHPQLKSKMRLKPVMCLKSKIIQIKEVKKGAYISYGYTHQFKKNSKVATIPVGYADGFLRYLSNKGEVLIHGKKAPMVGVVCMDVFMVDIGHIPQAQIGDEVVLLGRQKNEAISVEAMAERIQTVPWEIFCHISSRVPRKAI